jgi:DNA-binding MarR family transcriptional regulator
MTISELFQATETIRKHANEREFPSQVLSIFLAIASAKNQDIRQGDLEDICGMSPSSVSRNVSWLGPRNKLKRRDGLKWVEIYEDPLDYKRKRVRLSALGRLVIKEATYP